MWIGVWNDASSSVIRQKVVDAISIEVPGHAINA
jgi:hypothetical protein